jgi:hypothetical protein
MATDRQALVDGLEGGIRRGARPAAGEERDGKQGGVAFDTQRILLPWSGSQDSTPGTAGNFQCSGRI